MGRLMLKNKEGDELEVTFCRYREGDERGMIDCIRDEYGNTYFKREFYVPEYIKRKAEEGTITFLTARTQDDEIAGMMILKQFYPEESMCEIASQIFRKRYRGYGIAMPFFEYGMEILRSRSYTAAFCLPVLFHTVTQRLLYRIGLRAAGLVLNVFDLDRVIHSYDNGRNRKHSQGVQVCALGKTDAGILYMPARHRDFCGKIYRSLGVKFQIAEPKENTAEMSDGQGRDSGENALGVFPGYTDMTYKNDDLQANLEIRIHRVGQDLPARMRQLHSRFPLRGKQTAGIFLNCNDPGAIRSCELLEEMGYFFTGLKPLCSQREYLILHHPGEVEIYFDDYQATEEFQRLIQYIEKEYQKRRK